MYTLYQLLEETGISERTLGNYIHLGLLPRPAHAGQNTHYTEEHVVRILAIGKMRNVEGLSMEVMRDRLDAMSPSDLHQYVWNHQRTMMPPVAPDTMVPPAPTAIGGRTWTRYELIPGVELHIDIEAPPESKRLADQLVRRLHARQDR
jgi:DNA-binding transcriptional MerR regulator